MLVSYIASNGVADAFSLLSREWKSRLYAFADAAPTDWTDERLVSTGTFSNISTEQLDQMTTDNTASYRDGIEALRVFRGLNET